MRLAPDLQQIKSLLSDIVSRGDQAAIGNILGVTAQDISNRFNPDNARKPALVEALRELWAISLVNQDAAQKLKAYIDGLFSAWLDPVKTSERNLSTLLGDASQEVTDLIRARLEGKPIHTQREEALAAQAALTQFIAGLDGQFELRSSNVKDIRKA